MRDAAKEAPQPIVVDAAASIRARLSSLSRYEGAWFALLGASLLLSQLGYSFERGDQLQYLLLPYRTIYPDFLPGDWFTWKTTHYHRAFSVAVIALHAIAGERGFAWAMLGAQFYVLAWLSHAIWRLSRALGLRGLTAAAAIFALAVVRHQGLAGDTLNHAQLLPSDMAVPPFVLACAAWLEGRLLSAGIWLGLSGLLHANFTVLGPLVLAPPEAYLWLRTRKLRPLLLLLVPYALIAAPVLSLIVRDFVLGDTAPGAISIVLAIRLPHHYELSKFAAEDFWWLGLILIVATPFLAARDRDPLPERVRLLWLALSSLLLIGFFGALLHLTFLMRLFVWRMSIVLIILALIFAAQSALWLFETRARRPSLFWLLACVLVLQCFVRDDLAQAGPLGLHGGWFALPAALPLLAGAVWLARSSAPSLIVSAALCALPVAWTLSVWRSPLVSAAVLEDEGKKAQPLRGFRLGEFHLHPRRNEIFDAIRDFTPPKATFMVPPSMIDFRLLARRAIYVDWKCAPMKGDEALEWKRRMLALFGTDDFPIRGYELRKGSGELYLKRKLKALANLARKEHIDYVIAGVKAKVTPGTGLIPIISNDTYRVYLVEDK